MSRALDRAPVVLLGASTHSLPFIRSLGRTGVPVLAVVRGDLRPEHRSRYLEVVGVEGEGAPGLLACLEGLARRFAQRPMLVPMQDDAVLFVSRHREQLAAGYRFALAPVEIIEGLVSKDGMEALADRAGVEQPGGWAPRDEGELVGAIAEMRFPVLIKPVLSRTWNTPQMRAQVGGKVVPVAGPEALLPTWSRLRALGPEVVIQEEIPGADDRLVYYVGYFDERSRPLASFTGTKLRLLPAHYGSASVARSDRYDAIIELSEAFMRAIGYRGHVGIEYKIDPRDGRPKLIEVNARFGLWDGLGARCGIDFARIAYDDVTGRRAGSAPPLREFTTGVRWICMERDLWAFLHVREEGSLRLGAWLRELLAGPRQWAYWAADDPLPFAYSTAWLARSVLAVARDKFVRRLGLTRGPRAGAAAAPAPPTRC